MMLNRKLLTSSACSLALIFGGEPVGIPLTAVIGETITGSCHSVVVVLVGQVVTSDYISWLLREQAYTYKLNRHAGKRKVQEAIIYSQPMSLWFFYLTGITLEILS